MTIRECQIQRELDEKQAQEVEAKYLASLPERFIKIIALAQELSIDHHVMMDHLGPNIQLWSDWNAMESALTYESEEWEVTNIEEALKEMKAQKELREHRMNRAQTIFASLDETDQELIKEFIHLL